MAGGAVGRDVGRLQHDGVEAAEETVVRVGHVDGCAERTVAVLFDISRFNKLDYIRKGLGRTYGANGQIWGNEELERLVCPGCF